MYLPAYPGASMAARREAIHMSGTPAAARQNAPAKDLHGAALEMRMMNACKNVDECRKGWPSWCRWG